MVVWTEKDALALISLYQNKTGIMEWTWDDVTAWAEERGVIMPVPPTPREMLKRCLQRAARSERRTDSASSREYRGLLPTVKVINGQYTIVWFDADGPGATRENMEGNARIRREQMLNDGVRLQSDLERWNQTHPMDARLEANLDLAEEVEWRLNAPEDDAEDRKAG